MNWLAYFRDNLAGAWQIIFGRPEGLNRLDTSIEGFWRSFAVVIVVAPIAFLAMVGEEVPSSDANAVAAPLTAVSILLYGITLLVDWFAFPLVFALLAPSFGLGSRYVPFIVARNWASIYISAFVAIVHVLRIFGLVPIVVLPYALIVVLAIALRLSYVIVRTTLSVSITMALPIVVLDFLLSLAIWSISDRIG
jgi:hypothetical protein